SASLTVKGAPAIEELKPEFTETLKDLTDVEPGQAAEFAVKVKAFQDAEISWCKDNMVLKDDGHYKISNEEDVFTLRIQDVSPEDSGTYTCKAKNKYGEDSASASLTMKDTAGVEATKDVPPRFDRKLEDQTIEEGDHPIILSCEINSDSTTDVEWIIDGHLVEPSKRVDAQFDGKLATMTFKQAKQVYSGEVTVRAKNPYGVEECSAILTVTEKEKPKKKLVGYIPEFVKPLTDVKVKEGKPAKLKCGIMGDPLPMVEWFFMGKPVEKSNDITVSFKGPVATFIINEALPEHSGEYTCKVTNDNGTVECSATLTVELDVEKHANPPELIEELKSTKVESGEDVVLECKIKVPEQPDYEVEWFWNGKRIYENKNRKFSQVEETFTIKLTDVMTMDEGEYKIKVSNIKGDVSTRATLSIAAKKKKKQEVEEDGYAPMFTKRFHDAITSAGDKTTLECRLLGSPDPDIQWKKDGVPIEPSDKFNLTRDGGNISFTINGTNPEDAGTYTCVASNASGKVECSANLQVEGGEIVTDIIAPETAAEAASAPEPQHLPPHMPMDAPRIRDSKSEELTLKWKSASIPDDAKDCPITYTVEVQEPGDADWTTVATDIVDTSHNIGNLDPEKDYRYRVIAVNEYGPSTPTLGVTREGEKDTRKKMPPRSLYDAPTLSDMTDDGLNLSWSPATYPSYAKPAPIKYNVEQNEPPSKDWKSIAGDIPETQHRVDGLDPFKDYKFRVTPLNEYGSSEPSSPVKRPKRKDKSVDEENEDQNTKPYPPRMPMETPRIIKENID
ncbi:unnamed protein product, partial [Owenia fusiformis]